MKISCTPISMARTFREGGVDVEGFVNFCAEHGCDAIDILDSRCYTWMWKDHAVESARLPGWLEQAGIEAAVYACGNSFAKHDDADFEAQVDIVINAIREAEAMGLDKLRIFGGYVEQTGGEEGMTAPKGFERILSGIDRCLPEAEKAGVTLALENHGRLPGHGWEIAAIIEHFDSPLVRCTFDVANFMSNSMDEVENPVHALEWVLPYVAHVHVKDYGPPTQGQNARGEGYVAGEGEVPIRQVVASLEAAGYDGYYSLEYEAGFKTPEPEGMARSFAYLCELRERLGVLGS